VTKAKRLSLLPNQLQTSQSFVEFRIFKTDFEGLPESKWNLKQGLDFEVHLFFQRVKVKGSFQSFFRFVYLFLEMESSLGIGFRLFSSQDIISNLF